ncbi:MAG: choice-of-anchor Q domain-containing protein [Gammaproteobacteria bacterium]
MNTSHHPEMPDIRIPSDLRRAFEHAAEDAGLPLIVLPQAEDLFRRFADHYLPLRALPRRARRALERRRAGSIAALALLLALGEAPAWAATIPVDGIGCTLVEAITTANSDSPVGGCTGGSGADTIVLAAGSTHTLMSPIPDDSLGYSGLPLVTSPITIEGNGSTVRRENGAPDFRVFTVRRPGQLTLRSTTVSGGKLQGLGGGLFDVDLQGGGLLVYEGVAVLENSTVTGNIAGGGGGISSGGGVLVLNHSTVSSNTAYDNSGGVNSDPCMDFYAYLRIDSSTISGNYTRGSGGGVSQFGGTALITNSVIAQNYAGRSCGGLDILGRFDPGDTTTIVNSTIAGNTAAGTSTNISFTTFGGGVCNDRSPLTIMNTTVSGNVALRQFFASGGGIYNGDGAPLTLINTTISSNRSEGDGGGIGNSGSPITLIHSTITGNVSASTSTSADDGGGLFSLSDTVTLRRTLIAGNAATGSGPEVRISSGPINVGSHNLFGHSGQSGVVGFSPGATDIVPGAGLGAILHTTLANNGGPTPTHILIHGSPALDASPANGDCQLPETLTDQRGIPRPQGAACDIGAVEGSIAAPPPGPAPSGGCRVNGVPGQVCLGTPGPDTITGTPGPDTIAGLGGNDTIRGGGGNDRLSGGPGRDRLIGGPGNDRLQGDRGKDALVGGPGRDRLNGGKGRDRCKRDAADLAAVSCE